LELTGWWAVRTSKGRLAKLSLLAGTSQTLHEAFGTGLCTSHVETLDDRSFEI
jgi:hypothetical protein